MDNQIKNIGTVWYIQQPQELIKLFENLTDQKIISDIEIGHKFFNPFAQFKAGLFYFAKGDNLFLSE